MPCGMSSKIGRGTGAGAEGYTISRGQLIRRRDLAGQELRYGAVVHEGHRCRSPFKRHGRRVEDEVRQKIYYTYEFVG